MYVINALGRRLTFATLSAAKATADEIFEETGVIVGIFWSSGYGH